MPLTERDTEILTALSCSVRMMTLEQMSSHWWTTCRNPSKISERRLTTLLNQGLLATARVLAADLPTIDAPVASWFPGQVEPDLGSIAWQLQSRWKTQPKPVRVYLATTQTSNLLGGKACGRIKNQFHASHDLGVSQVYLRIRETRPQLIPFWVGEDQLAPYRKQQKLPDAIIANSTTATPKLVVEFGGAYDKERVTEFHRDCEQRAVPYEIW